MEKDESLDELLLDYLNDEEPVTWNRAEESIILAKINEIIDVLNKSIQPLNENKSLRDLGVKTRILNDIGDAKILLEELSQLLIAMKHK